MTRIRRFLLRWSAGAVVTALLLIAGQTAQAGGTATPESSVPPADVSPDLPALLSFTLSAEKRVAYPGETIPVIVRLGYATELTIRDIQYPTMLHPGLTLREAAPPSLGSEVRNGRSWTTMEFRYIVSGKKAGEFNLGPVTLACSLLLPAATGSPSFFGDAVPERRELKAEGVTVAIAAFPLKGKPADFRGAVGDFRLAVTVTPRTVMSGNPVTVTSTISGDGTMDTVTCPAMAANVGFSTYPPQARRLKGATVCEQVLTPIGHIRQVPPVFFSYFDSMQGSYRTVRQGPFPVTITDTIPPPRPPVTLAYPAHSTSHPGTVRADVAPVSLHRRYLPVVSGILLLALAGGSLGYYRRREATALPETINPVVFREGEVELNLETVLAEVESGGSPTTVFRALQQSLGVHYQIPPQAITAGIVDTHLRPEGSSDLAINLVETLFEECDRVRYGGGIIGREERETICRMLKELHCRLETIPTGTEKMSDQY